jgi:hypothetical protein
MLRIVPEHACLPAACKRSSRASIHAGVGVFAGACARAERVHARARSCPGVLLGVLLLLGSFPSS